MVTATSDFDTPVRFDIEHIAVTIETCRFRRRLVAGPQALPLGGLLSCQACRATRPPLALPIVNTEHQALAR